MKKILFAAFTALILANSAYGDKLKEIQEQNVLKAGLYYDFEPFSFIDEENRIAGFEIDMLRYFAHKLKVNLQIFQITPANRFDALLKNKVDILPYSVKIGTSQDIDFSDSYLDIKQSFLIRKNSKFINIYNFTGKNIAYFDNTLIYPVKKDISKLRSVQYHSFDKAVEDLKNGKIDAVTENRIWCQLQKEKGIEKLQFTKFYFNDIFYSYGIKPGEERFKETINKLIKQSISEGTFDELYEKWLLDK